MILSKLPVENVFPTIEDVEDAKKRKDLYRLLCWNMFLLPAQTKKEKAVSTLVLQILNEMKTVYDKRPGQSNPQTH